MLTNALTRRRILAGAAAVAASVSGVFAKSIKIALSAEPEAATSGCQRLSLESLRQWESLQYRGYHTFLCHHIAALQPKTVVMMNSGISDSGEYNVDYAWPSDLIAIERNVPPGKGHQKWRTIEDKQQYYTGRGLRSNRQRWVWGGRRRAAIGCVVGKTVGGLP